MLFCLLYVESADSGGSAPDTASWIYCQFNPLAVRGLGVHLKKSITDNVYVATINGAQNFQGQ